MKISTFENLSKGQFRIKLQPYFELKWENNIINYDVDILQMLESNKVEEKSLSGGIYFFIKKDSENKIENDKLSLPKEDYYVLFPAIQVENIVIESVLTCKYQTLQKISIRAKEEGAFYNLSPIYIGDGDFDFVHEPRNAAQQMSLGNAQISYGCDISRDGQNCWIDIIFE